MSDYIPDSDAEALLWLQAFSAGISASPGTYYLSPSDATTIASAVSEYAAALTVANTVPTRTKDTINIKDTKLNAAKQLCRQYAVDIKYNAGIDDNAKIAIGVRPVNNSRAPRPCPQTSPVIAVIAATPGAHTLRYVDSMDPTRRAKPAGAIGLQVYVHLGDAATVDESTATFRATFTRNPGVIPFEPADDGKMASYFARWVGIRGDTGPWSNAVSMRVAA